MVVYALRRIFLFGISSEVVVARQPLPALGQHLEYIRFHLVLALTGPVVVE